ncbi:hypothetical protein, partial [Hoylesella marshii]
YIYTVTQHKSTSADKPKEATEPKAEATSYANHAIVMKQNKTSIGWHLLDPKHCPAPTSFTKAALTTQSPKGTI